MENEKTPMLDCLSITFLPQHLLHWFQAWLYQIHNPKESVSNWQYITRLTMQLVTQSIVHFWCKAFLSLIKLIRDTTQVESMVSKLVSRHGHNNQPGQFHHLSAHQQFPNRALNWPCWIPYHLHAQVPYSDWWQDHILLADKEKQSVWFKVITLSFGSNTRSAVASRHFHPCHAP